MHRVHNKAEKTSSPFQYILQAAMGQCSNLPADGKNKEEVVTTSGNNKSHRGSYGRNSNSSSSSSRRVHHREQRDSLGYHGHGRPPVNDERHSDGDVMMEDAYRHQHGRSSRDVNKLVNIAKQGNTKFEHYMEEDDHNQHHHQQHVTSPRHGRGSGRTKVHPSAREEVFPPPPAGSVRTRCYRLNLDAPVILSPTHDHLGPMPYEPPVHLLPSSQQRTSRQILKSNSSDSIEKSPTQIAINTARIFRGITVDKNGTILSQNARATRSSRGKEKSKQAASSRQQEKINKAKDLVDETVGAAGNGKENSKEKSNMVSLVIIGEYDEMKQLVRDGAKKLRDAEGLPDEALLAINRPRQTLPPTPSSSSASSRKRFSSPKSSKDGSESRSRSRNRMSSSTSSHNMPKLKSHPRDRPSSRRLGSPGEVDSEGKRRYSSSANGDKCNDMNIFGGRDSDWSDALGLSKGFDTIWNCGATGTNSPNNKNNISSSPGRRSSNRVRYDNRNESNARFSRGGGVAAERDPVSKDVMIL